MSFGEGILSSAHITDKMASPHNSYARNAQMQSEKFAEFLGVFVDVARENSFSGAGRRRGRTPSSIGRQIDALEAYLDTPLFLRSTRHLTLTDAGEILLIRARQILDSLEDTQQELASMKGEVTGVLRVACYPTFGKRYVLPVMGVLAASVSGTESRHGSHGAAGRSGSGTAGWLFVSVKWRTVRLLVVGSPCKHASCAQAPYLAQAGMPETRADIASHRLIDKLHGTDLLG
jgi:DNA-binding transcriptional LysR family regulator